MSKDPLNDILGEGVLVVSDGTLVAGPAFRESSGVIINPTGIIDQVENYGTVVFKRKGDGRFNVPIQPSAPATPQPGDIYLEQIAGVTELVFVDSTSTPQIVSGGGGGGVTPTVIGLSDLGATSLASILVDSVGSIEWALTIYNPTTGVRYGYRLWAGHDGTTIADAVTSQLNTQGTIAIGTDPGIALSISLSGAGAGQTMDLEASAAPATGWFASIVAERMTAA